MDTVMNFLIPSRWGGVTLLVEELLASQELLCFFKRVRIGHEKLRNVCPLVFPHLSARLPPDRFL